MNTICDIKKEDQGATWTTMNHRKWLTAQYSYKVYIELLQYLKNSIKLNFNKNMLILLTLQLFESNSY